MTIKELINLIPQGNADEALYSIESVKVVPADNTATIRCYLANKFRLTVSVAAGLVTLSADGLNNVYTSVADFIPTIKKFIYEIDDLIAAGYSQPEPKPCYIFADSVPTPPRNMDLPVWDEKTGKWYDAEY